MRKQLVRLFVATGTVAGALALAVPSAMAAGVWSVAGGLNWASVQAARTTFVLTDATTGIAVTCTVAAGAGTVVNQVQLANSTIGNVTSSSFGSAATKCAGPLGSTGIISQKANTTGLIIAGAFAAGVTTATITGFDEILSINSILGACTAEIAGTAGITYANGNQLLQFTVARDILTSKAVAGAGCAGLIKNGDVITFSSGAGGETVVGAPNNPIIITSP
ncbi:MAG TPA: hypothetical protein VFQ44_00010 [Streptosporangiaceae bacterium]|nr:hypothetical protein [Streptosporangiaceae bacterium]